MMSAINLKADNRQRERYVHFVLDTDFEVLSLALIGRLTKTDQIAVRVLDREFEHSLHLLRAPLSRALLLDRAPDGHDIINVDILSCGRVRGP